MLLEKYLLTRKHTENLCDPLEIEDYIPQAVDFASPPKWHLAHVTWFFEQMILKKFLKEYDEFHPQFNFLFNSYYRTVGERAIRSQRGFFSRPTVEQVYQYRAYVDEHMQKLLSDSKYNQLESLIELVILGINHEQQHQELLITDLKYVFGLNPLFPEYSPNFNKVADNNINNNNDNWITISEGQYEIGHDIAGGSIKNALENFCFDNELNRHSVLLQTYQIANALVTNGEYMEFIEDNGYDTFNFWLDEGWTWLKTNDVTQPLFWKKIDNKWFYYTLAGLQPVDPNAMLSHISFYEANAFASWKNMRLPTEFEWEAACMHFTWGKRWEWTSSAYQAYPNFKVREDAVGEYNGKFMINTMVLRGASVVTPESHKRYTYRNFFHPQMQWQYSGIRLVK
ncbi:MAG: ergothioneine biosynthesis protein EgtB [Cocleimonas sp.]|jgi:ergothioneine biosynthesis protein EgtB